MAFVKSVNISERKGTRKTPVGDEILYVKEQWGFERDAHAGDWHRQVSFLAQESIDVAREHGLDVGHRAHGAAPIDQIRQKLLGLLAAEGDVLAVREHFEVAEAAHEQPGFL